MFRKKNSIPKKFKKDKVIFIHIPKCAGSTFLNSYLGYQTGHTKAEFYFRNHRAFFEESFAFSFVRNPVNRFISAYNYIYRETLWSDFLPKYRKKLLSYGKSLDEVASKITSESELLSYPWFEPQHTYLEMYGKIIIDRVFRTETFFEDIETIKQETGLILRSIESINRSPISEKEYSELLSKSAIENLKKIYERDFILFGYY